MITKLDDYLIPSFELDDLETDELEQTGYVETEGLCFTLQDNKLKVYKELDSTDYNNIKLHNN